MTTPKKTPGLHPPWKKGQSGNPNGVPKASIDFRRRCREAMEAEGGGWDIAIGMMRAAKSRDKQWAVEFLASYAYGKPSQKVEMSGDQQSPLQIVLRWPEARVAVESD